MTDFYLGPCGTAKSSPPEQRGSAPLPLASLLLHPTCARGQVCLGAGDFLPSACPPLGPGHLRADGSRWGLILMLQTPPNTTATKVLVNCSCPNCIPVFSVLCLCSAMLSCFLSVNKMLVLIHYCVMICSLKNIVHGGAVLSQGMCGNGLWLGGGWYQRSQNLRGKPGSWAELGIQAGAVGWP